MRPLDPRNADRARLMLAMAWLMSLAKVTKEDIARAARLLDGQPDIRPLLSPIVVIKYLQGRADAARRKRFRKIRQLLQEAGREQRQAARRELRPADITPLAPVLDYSVSE